jgi:hypothetical protein
MGKLMTKKQVNDFKPETEISPEMMQRIQHGVMVQYVREGYSKPPSLQSELVASASWRTLGAARRSNGRT